MKRFLFIVCALLLSWRSVAVDAAPSSEYLIKAGYLYNFAMFVGWPADAFSRPDAPLVIGIVGSDPFGQALDRIVQNKRINGRPVVVRRLQANSDLRQSHILFVSGSDAGVAAGVAARLEGRPVLVVGEAPDFARRGGTINFVDDATRVRFEVNLDAAKKSRLDISAKLLHVAIRVVRGA
jgi:hypothetical protein